MLLIETNVILSKAIQNSIINLNRMRSFKSITYLSCLVDGYSNGHELCSATHRFVSTYEIDFRQGFVKNKERKLAYIFNTRLCYIAKVLLLIIYIASVQVNLQLEI